jgi:hypothetical protein
MEQAMQHYSAGEWRALDALQRAQFIDPQGVIALLRAAGVELADRASREMVCRWVSVAERAVPPAADTIIRTITRTLGTHSETTTHWLDGLLSPLP